MIENVMMQSSIANAIPRDAVSRAMETRSAISVLFSSKTNESCHAYLK
jgi:hypothetical protein